MTTLHRVNGSDFVSNWKFTLCFILSHIENRKKKKIEKENEVSRGALYFGVRFDIALF